jgi:hypothetical protein
LRSGRRSRGFLEPAQSLIEPHEILSESGARRELFNETGDELPPFVQLGERLVYLTLLRQGEPHAAMGNGNSALRIGIVAIRFGQPVADR